MSIQAVKTLKSGKVLKQTFSDEAWKRLGSNKGGWFEQSKQKIENDLDNVSKRPDMGPAFVPKSQKIENTLGKTEEEVDDKKETSTKDEFMEAVKGISHSQIKDFFDKQKEPVSYRSKAKDLEMQKQLAEFFSYDLVKFQETFF